MGRDVLWTIICIWVVYKLYNAFKSTRTIIVNKTDHHHYHAKKEGTVTVEKNTSNPKGSSKGPEGEYVDFEEVKE